MTERETKCEAPQGEGRDRQPAGQASTAERSVSDSVFHRHERAVDEVPDQPAVIRSGREVCQLSSAPASAGVNPNEIFKLLRKCEIVQNDITPVRLRPACLKKLGPMFVKMGQILANRSEILPQRFCDELPSFAPMDQVPLYNRS